MCWVRRHHYSAFTVQLIQADFNPFIPEESSRLRYDLNYFRIKDDKVLTERAIEVLVNVRDYIMSYNYDDSDSMTDYFNTNFYLTVEIGSYKKPYQCVIPQLTCAKSKLAPEFKHPEGAAHKAIRKALNGAVFQEYKSRSLGTVTALGEITYYRDEAGFSALTYAGYKTAQKRVAKLEAAGIKCHISGYRYCLIVFDGYTPETEAALERERQEEDAARKAWEENPTPAKSPKPKAEKKSNLKDAVESIVATGIEIIDYSEKAFAIIGDTKPIKDTLKALGGNFNGRLSCGAGWIFSKAKLETVKQTLSIA